MVEQTRGPPWGPANLPSLDTPQAQSTQDNV